MPEHEEESEEDLRKFDAALESVYEHAEASGHGTIFFVLNSRLEYACYRCGEVLYEGPAFDDPMDGYMIWRAPRRKARAIGVEQGWRQTARRRRRR